MQEALALGPLGMVSSGASLARSGEGALRSL